MLPAAEWPRIYNLVDHSLFSLYIFVGVVGIAVVLVMTTEPSSHHPHHVGHGKVQITVACLTLMMTAMKKEKCL